MTQINSKDEAILALLQGQPLVVNTTPTTTSTFARNYVGFPQDNLVHQVKAGANVLPPFPPIFRPCTACLWADGYATSIANGAVFIEGT